MAGTLFDDAYLLAVTLPFPETVKSIWSGGRSVGRSVGLRRAADHSYQHNYKLEGAASSFLSPRSTHRDASNGSLSRPVKSLSLLFTFLSSYPVGKEERERVVAGVLWNETRIDRGGHVPLSVGGTVDRGD